MRRQMLIEERREHKTSIPIYILCTGVEQNILFCKAQKVTLSSLYDRASSKGLGCFSLPE